MKEKNFETPKPSQEYISSENSNNQENDKTPEEMTFEDLKDQIQVEITKPGCEPNKRGGIMNSDQRLLLLKNFRDMKLSAFENASSDKKKEISATYKKATDYISELYYGKQTMKNA